jgi:hypothetical protein
VDTLSDEELRCFQKTPMLCGDRAALCAADYHVRITRRYSLSSSRGDDEQLPTRSPPLFASQAEYDAFLARHNAKHRREVDANTLRATRTRHRRGQHETKVTLIAPDGGRSTLYSSNQATPWRSLRGSLR